MISYLNSILPTDAAYYTLNNASIQNDQLTIQAGGYASITLDTTLVAALSAHFKVNVMAQPMSNNYQARITCSISATTTDTQHFHYFCNLSTDANGLYSAEIEMIAQEYTTFEVRFYSMDNCVMTLWELCPEAVGDTEVIIEGIKQSLPRLLYDYNTTKVTIGQSEQIVAIINCNLIQNTDLQGHFLMNFTASARCSVYLRFYNNDVTELFSPNINLVEAGYNTIEIPHAYIKVLQGDHNIYVTAQCTNGTLVAPIRGILFTIDGGYLATRLSDPVMDVQDLAIKQLTTDDTPSEVWAVGVDNNNVIVKKRAYKPTVANEAWSFVADLGEGKSGVIEFDGEFVMRPGTSRYTIETEEMPFVAVIDMSDNLVCYMEDFEEDPELIATNVTQCSIIRGYKSTLYPEQDQGIILAWVTAGKVYYRQYSYYNGSYTWLPVETLVNSGTATHVQVHRLNDYRVGFIVQDSTAETNTWYVTARTYVAQAVPGEEVPAYMSGYGNFIHMTSAEVDSISHAATQNDVSEIHEPYDTFSLTWNAFDHITTWDDISNLVYDITVTVNSEVLDSDKFTVTIEDNSLIITLAEATYGSIVVTFATFANLLLCFNDDRSILCETSTRTYTWIVANATAPQPETVSAVMSGTLTFTDVPVVPLTASYNENVTASVSGSLTFTDVLIAYSSAGYSEIVNSPISGSLVFTDVLVGEEPI